MNLIFTTTLSTLLVACGQLCTDTPDSPALDSTSTSAAASEGHQVIHLADGGRMEGEMTHGTRVGTWTSFFPDSTLRSRSEYVDGLEEGATIVYHPNGTIMYTGSYLRGQPFGKWVYYGPGGNELKRVEHDSTGAVIR